MRWLASMLTLLMATVSNAQSSFTKLDNRAHTLCVQPVKLATRSELQVYVATQNDLLVYADSFQLRRQYPRKSPQYNSSALFCSESVTLFCSSDGDCTFIPLTANSDPESIYLDKLPRQSVIGYHSNGAGVGVGLLVAIAQTQAAGSQLPATISVYVTSRSGRNFSARLISSRDFSTDAAVRVQFLAQVDRFLYFLVRIDAVLHVLRAQLCGDTIVNVINTEMSLSTFPTGRFGDGSIVKLLTTFDGNTVAYLAVGAQLDEAEEKLTVFALHFEQLNQLIDNELAKNCSVPSRYPKPLQSIDYLLPEQVKTRCPLQNNFRCFPGFVHMHSKLVLNETKSLHLTGSAVSIAATRQFISKDSPTTVLFVLSETPNRSAQLSAWNLAARDESGQSKRLYETEVANQNERGELVRQIVASGDADWLVILSDRHVEKVAAARCHLHADCAQCLGAVDPHCGWCPTPRRCTTRATCSAVWWSLADENAIHQCPSVVDLSPKYISVTSEAKRLVQFRLNNYQLGYRERLQCQFDNILGDMAVYDNQSKLFGCFAPPANRYETFDPFAAVEQRVVLRLIGHSNNASNQIVSSAVASSEIVYYYCAMIGQCKQCVSQSFACGWCPGSFICQSINESETDGCPRASMVAWNESAECPALLSHISHVASGTTHSVALPARNIPTLLDSTEYLCKLESLQHKSESLLIPARRISSSLIVCNNYTYYYRSNVSSITYAASILVNTQLNGIRQPIIESDNGASTSVEIYKCESMADSCGTCAALCYSGGPSAQSPYMCDWSSVEQRCVFDNQSKTCDRARLLCTAVTIDQISPVEGPVQGDFDVHITGQNLGIDIADVEITVAGRPCLPVAGRYVVAKSIVCRVAKATASNVHNATVDGPVTVRLRSGVQAVSMQRFRFWQVTVDRLTPNHAAASGQTEIHFYGVGFALGKSITVYFVELDQFCFNVRVINDTCFTCRLPIFIGPLSLPQTSSLTVTVGNDALTMSFPFTVLPDPTVLRVLPLKSIVSGGCMLRVFGQFFSGISDARLYVRWVRPEDSAVSSSLSSKPTVCQPINDEQLLCPTPAIPIEWRNELGIAVGQQPLVNSTIESTTETPSIDRNSKRTRRNSGRRRRNSERSATFANRLQLAFRMDLLDILEVNERFQQIVYVPDPVFRRFDKRTIRTDETLLIEGTDLDAGLNVTDVSVRIGHFQCRVLSLTSAQVICSVQLPAPNYPLPTNALPVKVRAGNYETEVGTVQFDSGTLIGGQRGVPVWLITGVASGVVILVALFAAIICFCKSKHSSAKLEYQKIRYQLDSLERSVRQECKQAFAELQTNMSDLGHVIDTAGIPFWDYRTYAIRLLRPSYILNDYCQYGDVSSTLPRLDAQQKSVRDALYQFENLLHNKTFLRLYLRVLEEQRDFTVKDKVAVASLLMTVFHSKMDYATDIVMTLLDDLIRYSVQKRHPKLMLRRTESVVEKMLSLWLSLTLYDYIKEGSGSGRALFLLCSALKHQMGRGPVDQVTHEAKYSLTEDKLLKQHLDYTPIILQARLDNDGPSARVAVLSCDTISQVKEKILDRFYSNCPYSLRPRISDTRLDWCLTSHGRITLQDVDENCQLVGRDWLRVHTVADYPLTDDSSVILATRHGMAAAIANEDIGHTSQSPSSESSKVTELSMVKMSAVGSISNEDDSDNSVPMTTSSASSTEELQNQLNMRGSYATAVANGNKNATSPAPTLPKRGFPSYSSDHNDSVNVITRPTKSRATSARCHPATPGSRSCRSNNSSSLSNNNNMCLRADGTATARRYVAVDTSDAAASPRPSHLSALATLTKNTLLHRHVEGLQPLQRKQFHLVQHTADDSSLGNANGQNVNGGQARSISEIYLTRLLSAKSILQQYIDNLMGSIFNTPTPTVTSSTTHLAEKTPLIDSPQCKTQTASVPLTVKFLFDCLDQAAVQYGINDAEVVHAWKNNSLPLRFWVNIILNPDFVFDIQKNPLVDSCMSVIAQTLMDSCSTTDHRLTKDSPSNKLLFAKDLPRYKTWVEGFYSQVRNEAHISDETVLKWMAEFSRTHELGLDTSASVQTLYSYALKYNYQMLEALEEQQFPQSALFAAHLQQVTSLAVHSNQHHLGNIANANAPTFGPVPHGNAQNLLNNRSVARCAPLSL